MAELHPEIAAWIETLPPAAREVALRYPPACYGLALTTGHYMLLSYDEHPDGSAVTVSLMHGADDYLAGVTVFGIEPEDLRTCGCGKWRAASDAQCEESGRIIDAEREAKELPANGNGGGDATR